MQPLFSYITGNLLLCFSFARHVDKNMYPTVPTGVMRCPPPPPPHPIYSRPTPKCRYSSRAADRPIVAIYCSGWNPDSPTGHPAGIIRGFSRQAAAVLGNEIPNPICHSVLNICGHGQRKQTQIYPIRQLNNRINPVPSAHAMAVPPIVNATLASIPFHSPRSPCNGSNPEFCLFF